MKTIVIDNEASIRNGLLNLLKRSHPELEIVGTGYNKESGLQLLRSQKVDLVFLDVELGDGTGMELLQELEQVSFQLVFITAYQKYAINAFRFSAIEFLLKPIDEDDLANCIEKVKRNSHLQELKTQLNVLKENVNLLHRQRKKLVVRDKENIVVVKLKDILYCQAQGAYTHLQLLSGQSLLASKNLKNFVNLLTPYGFHRVHHAYLVNQQYITRFNRTESMLYLEGDFAAPVSHRKKEALVDLLNDQILL